MQRLENCSTRELQLNKMARRWKKRYTYGDEKLTKETGQRQIEKEQWTKAKKQTEMKNGQRQIEKQKN